jgi:predicted lipoprotein
MKSSTRRSTQKLPRYAATFHGLHEWYEAMFEKLGWMVLAQAKGKNYKITAYKKSIANLIKSIEHVMTEYKDQNRVHDLNVLLMNTKVLQAHVNKDFK